MQRCSKSSKMEAKWQNWLRERLLRTDTRKNENSGRRNRGEKGSTGRVKLRLKEKALSSERSKRRRSKRKGREWREV